MKTKRKVFMDTFITAGWISLIWRILEMIFYGETHLRIVDDVIWLILFRYIYLAKWREVRLYEVTEKPLIHCPPRMRDKRDVRL